MWTVLLLVSHLLILQTLASSDFNRKGGDVFQRVSEYHNNIAYQKSLKMMEAIMEAAEPIYFLPRWTVLSFKNNLASQVFREPSTPEFPKDETPSESYTPVISSGRQPSQMDNILKLTKEINYDLETIQSLYKKPYKYRPIPLLRTLCRNLHQLRPHLV